MIDKRIYQRTRIKSVIFYRLSKYSVGSSVPNSDTNYRAIKTELGPEKLAELAEQRLGLPDNSLGRKLYRMTSGRPYLTL